MFQDSGPKKGLFGGTTSASGGFNFGTKPPASESKPTALFKPKLNENNDKPKTEDQTGPFTRIFRQGRCQTLGLANI